MSACGAFVDMIKFPYQSTMIYDPAGGTFDCQWLECNPDAKELPFPTAFGSSRYDPMKLATPKVGEIWVKAPPKSFGFLNGWLNGNHVCGPPEWWANGFPLGTPPIPVGPGGVPLCCDDGGDGAAFDFGFDWGFDS